jgi:biopolymer transport protein ExbB/TolQ
MKSAYELAMERLQKQSPSTPLTEEQNAELAEIDSLYRSKIAEKELLLKEQIRREGQAGAAAEVERLQQQLSSELRRLQEECDQKKEEVRNRKA